MSIGKEKSTTVVINFLDNSGKKKLRFSTLISIVGKNVVNVEMIGGDAYYLACQLKWAQVFAGFMRSLEFLAENKVRFKRNLKSIVPER